MAAVARGMHQPYHRHPDLMPRVLQNRIYPSFHLSKKVVTLIHNDLAQNHFARSHLLAPIKMLHAVALETIGILGNVLKLVLYAVYDVGHGEFKRAFGNFLEHALIVGNGVLFVSAGSVAAVAAIIIPSVLKAFKKNETLEDILFERVNIAPHQNQGDQRIEAAAQRRALLFAEQEIQRLRQEAVQRQYQADEAAAQVDALIQNLEEQVRTKQRRIQELEELQHGVAQGVNELWENDPQAEPVAAVPAPERRRARREHAAADRALRDDQDAAYAASLAVDQARHQQQQAEQAEGLRASSAAAPARRSVQFPVNPVLPSPNARHQPPVSANREVAPAAELAVVAEPAAANAPDAATLRRQQAADRAAAAEGRRRNPSPPAS